MRSISKWVALGMPAAVFIGAVAIPAHRAGAADAEPAAQFDTKGNLIFPVDYRHWTYLSSGYGMSYSAKANAAAAPPFDSVFVDPASERSFRETGHWPEGTVMVLEVRASTSKGSINLHGAYQSGAPLGLEVHVRDSTRFKGGWGFFNVSPTQATSLIPYTADCYSCHQQHAAVDTTFVQFYPTLLPVAQAKHSFSAAYLAEESAAKP
jgi:hypothetical protein